MLGIFSSVGPWEILIIAFVVLLLFGPKRLPQMGRSLGGAIKGFKDSVTGRMDKLDAEAEQEQQAASPPALPQAAPPPPAVPPAQPAGDPRERDTVV